MDKAFKELESFLADFGGTKMFGPLESAQKIVKISNKKGRIFLLTDGQV